MPYKICASLLAASNSVDSEATIECDAYSFTVLCRDLLTLFGARVNPATHKVEVGSPIQNTKALKNKVDGFIEKYKFLSVSVYQLRTYLQSLPENEHIIFHWGSPPTREQGLPIFSLLYSLKQGGQRDWLAKIYNDIFAGFVAKYDVTSFQNNSEKRGVGETDKTKRICRFCNNKREKVTFKTRAHAISESLGNKNIILYEECDQCNAEFGSGIERDLIAYLKPYACIFGIKGKNGIPVLKGKNFKLSRNDDGGLDLNYFLAPGQERGKFPVKLETFDGIVMQNIYRTLCKYALSVMDKKHLDKFKGTLSWIKGEIDFIDLPVIAILKSYRMVTAQPKITISVRTDNDNSLPYAVGEFRCTYITFVFVIPGNEVDNSSFTDKNNYNDFWKYFRHYSSVNEWDFVDFSSTKKKNHILQMEMKSSTDYTIKEAF
jgi:hypothetical protein